MSATDELRRLLDERGVEWKAPASFDGSNRYDTVAGGYWFHEFDGKITIHGLTPEQAIAATLGESMTDTEKAALERRIDELCAEVDRGKAEFKKMDAWHSQELKAAMDENAKMRKMNEAMWLIIRCAIGEVSARDGLPVIHEDDLTMLRNMRRDLRNEVDE